VAIWLRLRRLKMDKEKVIALLNEDLEGEHGAIIQYLSHAYAMGEGEMTCEIEAIAREEMRHLDWLAETIVELEEDAVGLYREHIKEIDDPGIKRLLKRILSDEESHHGDFEHFVDKAKLEGAKDVRGSRTDKVIWTLNWGVEHEYTVILQYMFQSYMTNNEEAKKELEDQAINEMQHLGWLAEKIVDISGNPVIEHTEVDRSTKTADMLRADIDIEKKVAAEYGRAAKEVEEPKLKELLLRLRDHELYHADVFGDLLKEEEKNPE
jgi:bacterioferritin